MRHPPNVWSQRLALLLGAIIGVSVGGFTVWFVGPVRAQVDLHREPLPYAFSSPSCAVGTELDPTTIVFFGNATTDNVHAHAKHHGRWGTDDGGQYGVEYFFNLTCRRQDGEDATAGITSSRYHHRHVAATDPGHGIYSLSTPHYEDIVYPECGVLRPQHAVRENGSPSMPEGGFNHAKLELGYYWHNWNNGGGAHHWLGYRVWDNTRHMQQCDGQEAWADGNVDFIEIP